MKTKKNKRSIDLHHMTSALGLAERGLGQVWPNPAVGCVIVNGKRVVGRGWTQPGGRPHAESEALRRANSGAAGATAYITLEPCAHHGQTPPCADALIQAGIARAVIAMEDPDKRVSGQGIKMLRKAGIDITCGVGCIEAQRINRGFILREKYNRPLVTLKVATSIDGRIATVNGHSKWVTGDLARARAHMLRATHDAILVGSGTVFADDPSLTCRLSGLESRSPVRIIMDGRLRINLKQQVLKTASKVPTWIITASGADISKKELFEGAGVNIIEVERDNTGNLDISMTLRALGKLGITRILVEGGAQISTAFFKAGLVDHISIFRGPMVIGGDGLPVVQPFSITKLENAPTFNRELLCELDDDILENFVSSDWST